MSWPLVLYVLMAAIRDKLVVALMAAMLVSVSLSIFVGSSAITEKGYFALVFAGNGLRLSGVFGLILFVIFFIRRSFESKDIELLLSRPVSRVQFLLSYCGALSLIAVLMGIVQGLCLLILGASISSQGHILWIVSLIAENIIMVNVALFFAMVLSSAAGAAMATAGFYVLARMMGQLLGIIDAHIQNIKVLHFIEYIMQAISAVMPRLDLMAQSSWLVYGNDNQIGLVYVLAQALIFTSLVVLGALIDLIRRQF